MSSGAIFQEGDIAIPLQHAFKHAIHHVNKDRTVLGNTRLVEKSAHVTPSNSFKASRKGMKVHSYFNSMEKYFMLFQIISTYLFLH